MCVEVRGRARESRSCAGVLGCAREFPNGSALEFLTLRGIPQTFEGVGDRARVSGDVCGSQLLEREAVT